MHDLNYCMPDLNYCGITAELLRNYCGITAELLSNRLNYCMPEKIHRDVWFFRHGFHQNTICKRHY